VSHDLSRVIPGLIVAACSALVIYYGIFSDKFRWGIGWPSLANKAFPTWIARILFVAAGAWGVYAGVQLARGK
jgi:hypothetical protein